MKGGVQSSGNLPNGEIKRKERLITKINMRNYEEKLSASILCRYYTKLSASIVLLCRAKVWEL